MAAFGYGSNALGAMGPGQTNTPDPTQYSTGSSIAQTVPGYQQTYQPYSPMFMPGTGQNPQATGFGGWNPTGKAMGDPSTYTYAWDQNSHGGVTGALQSAANGFNGPNYTYTPENRLSPWSNFVGQAFGQGSIANVGGGPVTGTMGPQAQTGTETPGYGQASGQTATNGNAGHTVQSFNPNAYANQFGNNANAVDPNRPAGSSANPSDPQSLQQLYAQINGLQGNQLQADSNNLNYYNQAFAQTATNYANAYANPLYAQMNPMSQKDTSNWLQASYNTLTNKLDQNGLL